MWPDCYDLIGLSDPPWKNEKDKDQKKEENDDQKKEDNKDRKRRTKTIG